MMYFYCFLGLYNGLLLFYFMFYNIIGLYYKLYYLNYVFGGLSFNTFKKVLTFYSPLCIFFSFCHILDTKNLVIL